MFTGIIEEVGTIKQIQKNPASAVLTIAADTVLEQTKIGDSIVPHGNGFKNRQFYGRRHA